MRKVYMVDSENVSDAWLSILSFIEPDDKLTVFFTDNTPKISYDALILLKNTEHPIEFIKCGVGGKAHNALDFQLVSELGFRIHEDPEAEYIVVSNDNGFMPVIYYWNDKGMHTGRYNSNYCRALERRSRDGSLKNASVAEELAQMEEDAEASEEFASEELAEESVTEDYVSVSEGEMEMSDSNDSEVEISDSIVFSESLNEDEAQENDGSNDDAQEESAAAELEMSANAESAVEMAEPQMSAKDEKPADNAAEISDVDNAAQEPEKAQESEAVVAAEEMPKEDIAVAKQTDSISETVPEDKPVEQNETAQLAENTVVIPEAAPVSEKPKKSANKKQNRQPKNPKKQKKNEEVKEPIPQKEKQDKNLPKVVPQKMEVRTISVEDRYPQLNSPEEIAIFFYKIFGPNDLQDAHNEMINIYGNEDTDNMYYKYIKENGKKYRDEITIEEAEIRFTRYVWFLLERAGYPEAIVPADLHAVLYANRDVAKNLNTFRRFLTDKYGKKDGQQIYSILKNHIKAMIRIA